MSRPGRRSGRRRLHLSLGGRFHLGRRGLVALAVAVVLVIVVAAVALASSGGDTAAKPPVTSSSSTTSTTTVVRTAPLTGLPDPTGVARGRSILAVKIENTPDARPQLGLDVADVVYEEVVEGGITRFWGVFNSAAPASVGPIRSVRELDPNIVTPLGGVVAFSGGTADNVAGVQAVAPHWVDEDNANNGSGEPVCSADPNATFCRESSRAAPHNLFGRTTALWQRGGTPVPPNPLFTYVDAKQGQTFTGDSVAKFTVPFQAGYDVTYQWDAAVGWRRIQHDQPFLSSTNVQIAATNVIIQFMVGGEGTGQLVGTGDAWAFSNGQLIKGHWSKASVSAPTQFTDAAGAPLALTPGRTWVELLPTSYGAPPVTPGAPIPPTTTTSTTIAKKVTGTTKKK